MRRLLDSPARIVSANVVASPISGEIGAFVHVELFERRIDTSLVSLGSVVLGDLITLETESLESNEEASRQKIDLIVRRADIHFTNMRAEPTLLERSTPRRPTDLPSVLVPIALMGLGGPLHVREHVARSGDRLRVIRESQDSRFRLDV